jgi:hypothetical protein
MNKYPAKQPNQPTDNDKVPAWLVFADIFLSFTFIALLFICVYFTLTEQHLTVSHPDIVLELAFADPDNPDEPDRTLTLEDFGCQPLEATHIKMDTVNLSELGTTTGEITHTASFFQKETQAISVTVVDTTPPELVLLQEAISIYKGQELDWTKYYTVKDYQLAYVEVDDSALLSAQSKHTYNIPITAHDKSGNTSTVTIQVQVR